MLEKIRRWVNTLLLLYIAIEVTATQFDVERVKLDTLFMSVKVNEMWRSSSK